MTKLKDLPAFGMFLGAISIFLAGCQATSGPNDSMMPGGGQAGTTPRGTSAEVAQRAQQAQTGDRLGAVGAQKVTVHRVSLEWGVE